MGGGGADAPPSGWSTAGAVLTNDTVGVGGLCVGGSSAGGGEGVIGAGGVIEAAGVVAGSLAVSGLCGEGAGVATGGVGRGHGGGG